MYQCQKGVWKDITTLIPRFSHLLDGFGQFQLFTDVLEIGLRSEW